MSTHPQTALKVSRERVPVRVAGAAGAIGMFHVEQTSPAQLQHALAELRRAARRLAQMPLAKRILLAEACVAGVQRLASEWVDAACAAKGIPDHSLFRAEEITAGPVATVRYLQLLINTLRAIDAHGTPQLPGAVAEGPDGRLRVPILPADGLYDSLVLFGFKAHAWMQAGVTGDDLHDIAPGLTGSAVGDAARIALVLGAGNVSSIGATDALFKIFQEGKVALLKMNPVNEYLGPIFARAFPELIAAGFLRIVQGGAEIGEQAIHHELVDEVHITGARETHDRIVWGPPGPDSERRKRDGRPVLTKPITSELGNVTPWIFVPGPYSSRQLDFQAENVAASVMNNASFNCVATKVLVTWKRWPQREEFLQKLQTLMEGVPRRLAYYPGATDRYRKFVGAVPADGPAGTLPWTLLRDVHPEQSPRFFQEESFVSVFVETPLDAATEEEFLERAVDFVNENLWGTLAAGITVHQRFRRRKGNADLWDSCLGRLKYGSIAVNHWPGLIYTLMSPPWGGHPGATQADAQSGIGWVHNTYMLKGVEKTVLEGPVTMFPKPFWFPTHAAPEPVAWKMLDLYCHPTVWKLQSFVASALSEQFFAE